MKRLLRDPMLHYFAVAGLLYLAHTFTTPDTTPEDSVIVVDQAILRHLDATRGARPADGLPDAARIDALVDDFVAEEALYRTALAMDLDRDDLVIRRRLVQKLTFLLDDVSAAAINPGEAELRAYFEAHAEDFGSPARLSFRHVYLAGGEGAAARAEALRHELNSAARQNGDARWPGDRFPFGTEFNAMTPAEIADRFGAQYGAAISALEPGPSWHGPLPSGFGYHLVQVTGRTPGTTPRFEAVRAEVTAAYRYHERQRLNRLAQARILERYRVVRDDA